MAFTDMHEAHLANQDMILEASRTGIWTIELEEGCEPRMYADRTMRRLLGVGEDIGSEECYQSWFRGIDPRYVGTVREAMREILKTGRSEVVYPYHHPTLGKIYLRCGGVPNKEFHKPGVCLNGYHQDITETMVIRKKQDQAVMEALEKVRQANSAKSEFLAHMSHDIRTPINGILGMLAVIERSPDDPEKRKECREKIRALTEHLLFLVNEVLEVSRLEGKKPAAVEKPFVISDILESCIMEIIPKAKRYSVHLEVESTSLQHDRVIGDPDHLKQILMNIIDNAVRYNRENGNVFIRVREISCKEDLAEYKFRIEDTGIGIGKDFTEHIYEPFSQENQSVRTEDTGIGLGMSIVKKLTDQMGGVIEMESQVGKGSVFQVTLPIRTDTERNLQTEDQEEDAPADVSGMHVLLVEDIKVNREIVQFILEDAGAAVETAEDGKAAVDVFAASSEGAFDCILMDLMMPVMNGLEAARVIRGMDRADAKTVPIIALSANAFEEDVAMTKDAGMNEHLSKPVDINRMFRTMRRMKDSREAKSVSD